MLALMMCVNISINVEAAIYSGYKAAKYAQKYAQKYAITYNKDYYSFANSGGDCANFVSQSLNAGNIPKNSSWTGGKKRSDFTNKWTVCQKQRAYFVNKGWYKQRFSIKNLNKTSSKDPRIEIGDIVYYDWTDNGSLDHVGIVTGISDYSDRLLCAHTSNRLNTYWNLKSALESNDKYDVKKVRFYVGKITYK